MEARVSDRRAPGHGASALLDSVGRDNTRSAGRNTLASPAGTEGASTDDEDEVFFGPMTTVELKKLNKQRDMHQRSTQAVQPQRVAGATAIQALCRGAFVRQQHRRLAEGVQCATPESSPLPVSAVVQVRAQAAARSIQRLSRGYLARRVFRRRREDLRYLAVAGANSVERRRRMGRTPLAPPEPPPKPKPVPMPMMLSATDSSHASPPIAAPLPRPDTMQGRALADRGPLSPMLPPPQAAAAAAQKPKTAYARSPLRRGLSIRSWFQRPLAAGDTAPPPVPKTPTTPVESPRPHSHKGAARRYLTRLREALRPVRPATPPYLRERGTAQQKQKQPVSLPAGTVRGYGSVASDAQRARHRHRRARSRDCSIVGMPAERRGVRRHCPSTDRTTAAIGSSPYTNSATPVLSFGSVFRLSHIMLVPAGSATAVDYQQPAARSPPPPPPPLRFTAHVRDASDSSGSSHRHADTREAVGAKLAMFKSSIGSLLARPLSPRTLAVTSQPRSLFQPPPPLPRPLPATLSARSTACGPSLLAALAHNRSAENIMGPAAGAAAVVQMPLSAVGAGFGPRAHERPSTATSGTSGTDTDSDVGIAAGVQRMAAPPEPPVRPVRPPARDSMSVSSISSMSVSSLGSVGSVGDASLSSELSDITMESGGGGPSPMDVSPPAVQPPDLPAMPPVESPISPRLSLRLSADAASFGFGLSALTSMLASPVRSPTSPNTPNSTAPERPESEGAEGPSTASEPAAVPVEPMETSDPAEAAEPPTPDKVADPVETADTPAGSDNDTEMQDAPHTDPEPEARSDSPHNLASPTSPASPDAAVGAEPEQSDAAEDELPSDPSETPPAEPGSSSEQEPAEEPDPNTTGAKGMVLARLRSLQSRRQCDTEAKAAEAAAEQQRQQKEKADKAAAGRRFRITQTAGQRDTEAAAAASAGKGKTAAAKLPKMGALQLDRLTKLNTRRNATYMTCQIEKVVEVRGGERPPSPSLLMQMRAQERRVMAGLQTGNDYHSIYSDSSASLSDSDNASSGPDEPPMAEDTRPLSPLLPAADMWGNGDAMSAADLPAMVSPPDAKRKSDEVAESDWEDEQEAPPATTATACAPDDDGQGKRRCREPPRHVQWGVRSVLRAAWLQGRAQPPTTTAEVLPPILVRRANEPDLLVPLPPPPTSTRSKRAASKLAVVKVVTVEYPESTSQLPEDDSSSSGIEDIPDESPDEEYIPRRSARRGGSAR
ncbi:hypothetical protein H4R19_000815 [Coemansia spiralis]|nr:hypothetical protein H4R19_000815 [Coemansia spiralis]